MFAYLKDHNIESYFILKQRISRERDFPMDLIGSKSGPNIIPRINCIWDGFESFLADFVDCCGCNTDGTQ